MPYFQRRQENIPQVRNHVRDPYDALTKESEEFKTLYNTPFEKLSAQQNDRLKELQAKHEAKKYEKALEEARNKRFTDTWDLVRGTRLEESFREKLRIGEDFKADFDRFKGSKHEEAARKTLQNAVEFESNGKKLNNTNAMHDVIDLAANISAETGKVVYFKDGETIKQEFIARQTAEIAKLEQMENRTEEDNKLLAEMKDILAKVESGKTKVNGDITSDGITLNLDSENPLEFTVGHEVTHSLEKAKVYDKLRDALYSYAKAKNVDVDKELIGRKAKYAGIENADAEKELVADLVGSYVFNDYDFVTHLSTNHRNVFQKVYDEIKHLCKLATAGSKAARDLERAKRQFEKAFREAAETNKTQTDTKHSISEVESYSDVGSGESVFRTGWLNSNPSMVDAIVKNRPQTKSEQFSDWFGNSQAINKSEEPLLVYHGTTSRFAEFNSDGKPIWFAPNVMYARGGAVQTNTADKLLPGGKVFGGSNERVIPAYIKAENPADFGNTSLMFEDVATDIAQNLGIDEAKLRNVWEKTGRNAELYKTVHSAEMVELLKQHGYDSIKAVEDGSPTWAVFESNQVKSAVANKGSFNISNPDIRYSLSDSETDNTYFDAVVNRDWETAERLVEEAAKKAGYTKVVYHGTDARFTKFDTDEESTAREQHAWMADYPDGTIFLAEDYDVADGYGERVMNLLLDTSDMKVFEEPDMYAHRAMDDKYGYEVYNYPVIAVKGKDMTIYATLDNTLVKSSDTVTYGDGGEIIPLSERFKHSDPDIRFSLSESVEETKDLVALHNLTGEKLMKSLELGGLPMPSLAITKADIPHSNFGEITLIFDRKTIDPKANKKNKVYSADAWTPVFPRVEYEADSKVANRVSQKLRELGGKIDDYFQRDLSRVSYGYEDYLDREGGEEGLIQRVMDNYGMKAAYLEDIGKHIEKVTKQEEAKKEYNPDAAEKYIAIMDILGVSTAEEIYKFNLKEAKDNYGAELETVYPGITKSAMRMSRVFSAIKSYLENKDTGPVYNTVTDGRATENAVDNALDSEGYEAWVRSLFSGIVKDSGIYNNKGYYTPSGNRRSFQQTHLPFTLENIVKAMASQNDGNAKNVSGFNGIKTLRAATAETFKSVDEMHQRKDRLQNRTQEEADALNDSLQSRLFKVMDTIDNESGKIGDSNPYIRLDTIGEIITEIGEGGKYSVADIQRIFKQYSRNISDDTALEVKQLLYDVTQMPVNIFEAKPQRVVSFDEAKVFVIPNDVDSKLKQELLNRGYSVAEYDPKVEGDRQRVVNQFEEYKFSLSNSGEAPFGRSINSVYGKDVMKQNPFPEIAPVVDPNNQPSKAWTVEEMFPDEQTQSEMERLDAARAQIYGALESALQHGTANEVGQLAAEYDSLTARIRELENATAQMENGRTDSLMVEEAPPEMEAPYYETEPTVLTKKATADIVRDVRKSLDLTNPQMADAKGIVERWRSGEIQTREQLVDALQDKFGKYTDVEEDYLLQEIKREIRTRRINVSKDVQRNFPDYADMMRRNRGRILFSKQGLAVDEVYQELNSLYPGYFPIEMDSDSGKQNAADQLERIIEIANTPHIKETERYKDMENIEEAADIIIRGIDNFRLNQDLALSERESRGAFADLLKNADGYIPEDIAPVSPVASSQANEAKPTKAAPEKVAPQKSSGKVAEVLTEASKPNKNAGYGMGVVSQVVDKGMAVENLAYETGNEELQPKYQAALSTTTEAKAQYFMEHGGRGVKPFKETVQEIQNSGKQNDFERYMYHAHNVDRMSLEQRFGVPNKAVYGDSITADASRAEVAKYEKKNPEFKAWAEEIYAITKWQRSLLVENGIISQETADLWEKMYPHYVPIAREDAKGANVYVPLDTNKTGVNAPIKKAVGGNSNIEPMLNTIAQRIEQTYRAIARNSFGIELKNTLGTTLDGQQNRLDVDGIIDTLEDQDSKLLKPGTMNSSPTFTVFENGERVEFEITEELFDSLKPANKILAHRFENSDKKIVRGIGKALEARRNLLTNWNPVFAWYRNPIKDIQDVAVNSQHPMQTYVSMPKAVVELFRDGRWAQEYHANGGKSNTYYDSRKNEFVEEKGLKKLFGKYEAAGEFIEEVPRLAEYIASRLNGRSVERSMLDAARVTTNFTAGGDFTKFLNSHGFTFLNASVQGASQHVRNFRENYHQQGAMGVVKTLAKYVIAGVPALVLNSLKWDDDEEYEELNDYVKQNYYVLWKTDDGKFFRIPKGRTAAVMGELMNQMENLVTGDDEVDFSTFFELFMNNIAPNNPLENNIIAPIGQVMSNTAWYGGDLVPARLQKLPAEEQYDESTDILSRRIGEATGTSPYKWNYLIDQYSGGLGDVFLPMMTPEAESGDNSLVGNILAPWKKEMTTDSVLNNKNPGDFYDLKDELEIKSNSSKATEEDTMRSMYMDSVSWEMSDLYKQKRAIQSSALSDSRKYEKVREIQEQINELAKNAVNSYNDIRIDGKYATVGDKRFDYSDYSGKWYEISGEYLEREHKAIERYGITPSDYWNNTDLYYHADWYFDDKYATVNREKVANMVFGGKRFAPYAAELGQIKGEDKNGDGKTDSGTKKDNVIDYINNSDLDFGERIITFKMSYPADDTYNYDIIDYLNGREDIDYQEMEMILKYLGFNVDSKGNITWD